MLRVCRATVLSALTGEAAFGDSVSIVRVKLQMFGKRGLAKLWVGFSIANSRLIPLNCFHQAFFELNSRPESKKFLRFCNIETAARLAVRLRSVPSDAALKACQAGN